MDSKQKKRLIIIVMVGVVLILITALGVPKLAGDNGICDKTGSYRWDCDIYLGPVMTGPLSLICKAQKGTWRLRVWKGVGGTPTGNVTATCRLPYPDAGMACTDASECNGRCLWMGGACEPSNACVGMCSENNDNSCQPGSVVEDGMLKYRSCSGNVNIPG